MSPSLSLFILVVLLVVGWFAVGTHFNVRKGDQMLRWLQDGLPVVGEKTTLRWLGSSVLELKIKEAKPPFHHAEIVFIFEPRDVAPVWAFARWRGRRDLFIFRATLHNRPSLQLEALDPHAWPKIGLSERATNWSALSVPPPLEAYAPANALLATELIAAAALEGCPVQTFLIRRDEPNFELQWRLDPLRQHSSRAVFETVHRLAARL